MFELDSLKLNELNSVLDLALSNIELKDFISYFQGWRSTGGAIYKGESFFDSIQENLFHDEKSRSSDWHIQELSTTWGQTM